MRFALITLLLALPALGGGCASIVCGTHDTVVIRLHPKRSIVLANGSRIMGAGVVSVARHGRIVVTGEDGRYIRTITPGFNFWFLGNFFIGGLMGMVIDIATGAVYDFPSEVTILVPPPDYSQWPTVPP